MPWLALTLGILLPLSALGGIAYYVKWKRSKTRTSVHEHAQPSISDEVAPLRQDVDLSSYIPDITEEMTYDEVLKFVRCHKVPQTKIDEIIHDNFGASEKKIHLFQAWLQRHGINEAYETLIRSLRNLGMRAAADKIERKLQAAVSSSE